ncbi:MAG: SMC-Scp complex subunit ScpB, partial [Synechococcaceae bacterium WB6_3A_227]|nr:SMC-Scp complex subunit ScpB [Synechococcaceae bacterium WB6_3A_227]
MANPNLSLPAQLEAVLYLKGRCLSLHQLSELVHSPPEEVELALITLMADYAHRDTALEIRQESAGFSLQLRADLSDL